MTRTSPRSCTAPDRWAQPPGLDATDAEVLAYLEHFDTCPYHAAYEQEANRSFDRLLRTASGGLHVDHVAAMRHVHADRPARVVRLSAIWSAAAMVVLLIASGLVWWQPWTPPATPIAQEPVVDEAGLGQAVDDTGPRLRFTAWVISDARHGRYTRSGVRYDKEALVAAVADQPFGTKLRLFNPVNGVDVVVTVVDRGPGAGELNVSSRVAKLLGFDGTATLLAEVLPDAEVYGIGP